MTAPALRDYQSTAIGGVRAALLAGYHSPLLVSPTGAAGSHLTCTLGGAAACGCHRGAVADGCGKAQSCRIHNIHASPPP